MTHKALKTVGYWLIHLIWGFPTFICALIVALFMLLTWHAPHRFGLTIYFISTKLKGCGFNIGPIFILSDDCKDNLSMKQHEHGHGLQNLWWGPLMLFVISFPSLIRFHYREFTYDRKRKQYNKQKITLTEFTAWLRKRPPYNSIWFEKQANELGAKYFPSIG